MAADLPAGVTVFERGWLSSNNVLFSGGGTIALVDSGYATHAPQTLALMRGALGSRPLELIVNTHLHSDHCGGNALLQAEFPGLHTLVPPGEAEAVRRWDTEALSYDSTGQMCPRFSIDGVLSPGSSIELGGTAWQVHASPGHDPHAILLFEPASRTLISADALWANGFGIVFPELDGEAAFDEVAATLDVIDSLRPRVVIPGHGSVFGGEDEVAAALARARSRLASFVADPRKHARHAMKVLLKFKLLEWQSLRADEFRGWACSMPYVRHVHARYFGESPLARWVGELVAELEAAGALRIRQDMIENA